MSQSADAATAQSIVIAAECLTKRFGKQEVVSSIDFSVLQGQCFGLLGPNGAGKTTTIKMILGQSPISYGSLQVFGRPMPENARWARKRIGVVPQNDNLDPDFTVVENLRVYGSYFGLRRGELDDRIEQLLTFFNLSDRANARVEQLSGGMKRRLIIARALINDPELIVLDEPTTGLDPQVRHMIWARLRELKQSGKTLLLTTHYMEEAERLCDTLVIIDYGQILANGSPAELIRRYVEPEVLELRGPSGDLQLALAVQPQADGGPACRFETIGDTVYCYTDDTQTLARLFPDMPGVSRLQRPANLEDVFLTITGRDLRE